MRTATRLVKSHWPFAAVLVLLGLVTVVINPLRQGLFDDDWSYALMVRHLLETGAYRLDNWAAANPVFQIYWGSLFARIFGFSFASLKVSTLVLLVGGLGGMYLLAREHGLSTRRAGLVTLILLVNPLTLVLGFSYMTDVPFLACLLLGLAFYTRAIRVDSYRMAILGSIFAAAAILIRVFGAAFLPGLALVWLLKSRKREGIWLFVAAGALPLLALGWQLLANTDTPNWAVPVHVRWQLNYVTNVLALPRETFWRLAIVLEYLALFSLPLIPAALAEWRQRRTAQPTDDIAGRRSWRGPTIVIGIVAFIAMANVLRPQSARWVMPILDWNFGVIEILPRSFAIALTLIMIVGAVVYARAFILRYASGSWRDLPDHQRLLDAVTLGLLLLQITYFQFGDEYLLPLLPFTLIVVAQRAGGWLDRLAVPTIAFASVVLVLGMLWVRGMQSEARAIWFAGDDLVARGVPADQIGSTWYWASYYGAFDDYLRAYGGHPPGESLNNPCRGEQTADPDSCARDDPRIGPFGDWLAKIDENASYHVQSWPAAQVSEASHPAGPLELVATVPYRDMFLREQHVYVYKGHR